MKLLELGRRSSDLAEILHGDINEGPRTTAGVSVGTGRIPPSEGVFSKSVLGNIFAADQDIFTKIGACRYNEIPLHVERSKQSFFENPKWRTAAKCNKLNRYNLAADCPIFHSNFA